MSLTWDAVFVTFYIRCSVSDIFIKNQYAVYVVRSLWEKVRQLEKGTPPPLVAVVTNIRYGPH